MTPVRLEPAPPRSRVKLSTTELPCTLCSFPVSISEYLSLSQTGSTLARTIDEVSYGIFVSFFFLGRRGLDWFSPFNSLSA